MTDLTKTEPTDTTDDPTVAPGGIEIPDQRPSAMHRSAVFARRAELEAAAADVPARELGQ